MSDQADTLRKLMQWRGGDDGFSVKVVSMAGAGPGVGKSSFLAHLGSILARSGLRILLVDCNHPRGANGRDLDGFFDVAPGVSLERIMKDWDQGQGSVSLYDALTSVEENLWLIPASAGLFELRHSDLGTRRRLLGMFEKLAFEVDLILVDGAAVHYPSAGNLLVVTPDETAVTEAFQIIKRLRLDSGVTQFGVIVNQVTDGASAQVAYRKLKDLAGRFVDVQLEYLGHLHRDEKITQAVMNRKILLDLDSRAPSIRCYELIAKRFKEKYRFTDEPARYAPKESGNTARFWRALLGEVKA